VASFEDRYRMVELACQGQPGFVPSRLEAGPGRSYTIHTVEKVRASLNPDDRLFFLIGADAFAEIQSWHRWEDLIRLVEFIVATRPGHQYAIPAGATVHRLDTLALPVSSSQIRQKLAAGLPVEELPPAVLQYIRSRGLYSQPASGQEDERKVRAPSSGQPQA